MWRQARKQMFRPSTPEAKMFTEEQRATLLAMAVTLAAAAINVVYLMQTFAG